MIDVDDKYWYLSSSNSEHFSDFRKEFYPVWLTFKQNNAAAQVAIEIETFLTEYIDDTSYLWKIVWESLLSVWTNFLPIQN